MSGCLAGTGNFTKKLEEHLLISRGIVRIKWRGNLQVNYWFKWIVLLSRKGASKPVEVVIDKLRKKYK